MHNIGNEMLFMTNKRVTNINMHHILGFTKHNKNTCMLLYALNTFDISNESRYVFVLSLILNGNANALFLCTIWYYEIDLNHQYFI